MDHFPNAGFDITCVNCNALIRVVKIAFGPDEKNSFDCPFCNQSLFSSDGMWVYDVERVLRPGVIDSKENHR